MPCSSAMRSTASMDPSSPARSAAARVKPSIGAPGAWTTNATASSSGLVADRVRRATGERHHLTGTDHGPLHEPVGRADVERELAVEHVVDLAGLVAVHDRRPTTRRHLDQDSEQRAIGLAAVGEHDDLVRPHRETRRGVEADR